MCQKLVMSQSSRKFKICSYHVLNHHQDEGTGFKNSYNKFGGSEKISFNCGFINTALKQSFSESFAAFTLLLIH